MFGVRRTARSESMALWRAHGADQLARLSPEATAGLALAMHDADLLGEAEAVLRSLMDSGSDSCRVVKQYALIAREVRLQKDPDLAAATAPRINRLTPSAARILQMLREVDPRADDGTIETEEIADGRQHIFCRMHHFADRSSDRGLVEKCVLTDSTEVKVWEAFRRGILAPPPFGPELTMPTAIEIGPALTCIYFAAVNGPPLAQNAFERDITKHAHSLGAFNGRNVRSSLEWRDTGLPTLREPKTANLLAELHKFLMRHPSLDGDAILGEWSYLTVLWKDVQRRRSVIPLCLLHNDFQPRHLFLVGGREVLIDFGNAAIGRIGWDLRTVLAESGESQFDDDAVDQLIDSYLMGVREFLPDALREDVVVELWWGYFVRIVWLARSMMRTMSPDYVRALQRAMKKARLVAEMSA